MNSFNFGDWVGGGGGLSTVDLIEPRDGTGWCPGSCSAPGHHWDWHWDTLRLYMCVYHMIIDHDVFNGGGIEVPIIYVLENMTPLAACMQLKKSWGAKDSTEGRTLN